MLDNADFPFRGWFAIIEKMIMENKKVFRTKTGFCHVLPDKIILTRDGVIGNIAKATVGNGIIRILLIYGGISIGLLYSAYEEFQKENLAQSIVFGLLAILMIYGILISLNNSAAPVIERSKIRNVKFKKAIVGLTRSRFEVLFEDENGRVKSRLMMLPGSMIGGAKETKIALNIMQEEKLIKLQ